MKRRYFEEVNKIHLEENIKSAIKTVYMVNKKVNIIKGLELIRSKP